MNCRMGSAKADAKAYGTTRSRINKIGKYLLPSFFRALPGLQSRSQWTAPGSPR